MMPFGRKPDAKGQEIDFDLVYQELIAPALQDAGIEPFRADVEIRAGSIHADMFQELLFADACLGRGMNLDVRLARRVPQFLANSVTFADNDRFWLHAFQQVTKDPRTRTLIMGDEVGPTPNGVSVHDRANRWQLYSALSQDLEGVDFIALWDGKPAGGPGGTEKMVEHIRRFTGRAPILIDPTQL